MISLKLDHSHNHLPCHPTRHIEQPISIHETDREQYTDEQDVNQQYYYMKIKPGKKDGFKTIESRAVEREGYGGQGGLGVQGRLEGQAGVGDEVEILPVPVPGPNGEKKKTVVKRSIAKLTPEDIYMADVMESAFQASVKVLPFNVKMLIMHKQKLIQDKIYLGISDKGANLLERMYEQIHTQSHFKDCVQENLIEMMKDIQQGLQEDILSNKFIIHKIIRSTKNDVIKNPKKNPNNPYNSTFNSLQTSNNLTSKDDGKSFASQSQPSQPSQQDYSLRSEQTRKAEDFIKKIQKEQIQMKKKVKQQEERKKSLEVRSMEEKRQFEEQIKNQRKNYLKRRIQAKKQIKLKQLQVRQKMNKQYKQFLQKYKNKTPLFKQKQLSFKKIQQEDKKKQQMILQKRKQQRKSIQISQLIQHQKKYKLLKKQKQHQKQNEKKLKTLQLSQSQSQSPQKNIYISKYHQIIAQQEQKQKQRQIRQDPKLLRSELIKKRDQYSRSVRENYMPKGDQAKRKELGELLEKLRWSERLGSGRLEPKERNQAGNQYLRRIHELIAQLRSNNKLPTVSRTIDLDQPSSKKKYKNYLEQLRPKRRYSIDYSQKFQTMDIGLEEAQHLLQKLERNAKRREVYVNGNKSSFDIDRTLEERKRIDDEYLEAVKVKMALINKFQ